MDLKNIGQFIEQAKKMQAQLKEKQQTLAKQTVTGDAGGGMVKIVKTGQYETVSVSLDPGFASEETAIQQDLIKAASNDADRKIKEMLQDSMSDLTSQLSLPDDLLKDKE